MSSKLKTTSSAIARAHLSGDPDAVADARRDHAAARIEVTIDRALAVAPPLTPAQIKHISALLHAGSQADTPPVEPTIATRKATGGQR